MSTPTPLPRPTPWLRVVAFGVLVAALVSLVVIAFTWPARTSEARDIPIAVAGPASETTRVSDALTKDSDTFTVQRADDRQDAVRLITLREVYGAVVLANTGAPEVLTAPAASPAVAQIMNAVAAKLQQQSAAAAAAAGNTAAPTGAVQVTAVVPLADDDASGNGLVAAAFPLVMGGMLGGILLVFLVHGALRRVTGLLVYTVLGGLAVSVILQGWFGILQGPLLENAAAFALALSSIAGTIIGAATIIGRLGVSIGPVLFLLFANPLSSSATPSSFLPTPWGTIGQWFPPGAGNRLLRSISYFPDADSAPQWLILGGWTLFGLALVVVGVLVHARRARRHHGVHVAGAEHAPDPLTV